MTEVASEEIGLALSEIGLVDASTVVYKDIWQRNVISVQRG